MWRTLPQQAGKGLWLWTNDSGHLISPPILLVAARGISELKWYRHRWRAGDLVMWDNRCTMHTATVFDATRYRRLLYRTIIA